MMSGFSHRVLMHALCRRRIPEQPVQALDGHSFRPVPLGLLHRSQSTGITVTSLLLIMFTKFGSFVEVHL